MATYFDVNAALGVREYPLPPETTVLTALTDLARLEKFDVFPNEGPLSMCTVSFDGASKLVRRLAEECQQLRNQLNKLKSGS